MHACNCSYLKSPKTNCSCYKASNHETFLFDVKLDSAENLTPHLIKLVLVIRLSALAHPLQKRIPKIKHNIRPKITKNINIVLFFQSKFKQIQIKHIKSYLCRKCEFLILDDLFHVAHDHIPTFMATGLLRRSLLQ